MERCCGQKCDGRKIVLDPWSVHLNPWSLHLNPRSPHLDPRSPHLNPRSLHLDGQGGPQNVKIWGSLGPRILEALGAPKWEEAYFSHDTGPLKQKRQGLGLVCKM